MIWLALQIYLSKLSILFEQKGGGKEVKMIQFYFYPSPFTASAS